MILGTPDLPPPFFGWYEYYKRPKQYSLSLIWGEALPNPLLSHSTEGNEGLKKLERHHDCNKSIWEWQAKKT